MTLSRSMGLIGPGRLGTAFACELAKRGAPLAAIAGREMKKADSLAKLAETVAVKSESLVDTCGLVMMAVPDDAIESVADQLSRTGRWHNKIALHTSGSLDSSALKALRDAGAAVGSIHPMQSFSGGRAVPVGTVFGIEGDPEAVKAGMAIADFFEGITVRLTAEKKPLYHAAACVAANYLVTLVETAQTMLGTAGLDEKQALHALLPLVGGVLENLRSNGTAKALTGPIARGDAKTIEKHLTALDQFHPELRELYTVLGEKTLELARKAGLDEEKAENIQLTFNN